MLHGAGIFTYKTGNLMVNASKYSIHVNIHALGMWDTQFLWTILRNLLLFAINNLWENPCQKLSPSHHHLIGGTIIPKW